MRQTTMAGERDVAVQKLRDLTVAVGVVAAAGVGVIAWGSWATIPGSTGSPASTGTPASAGTSGVAVVPNTENDDGEQGSPAGGGLAQAPPTKTQPGPGVVVSGGSR